MQFNLNGGQVNIVGGNASVTVNGETIRAKSGKSYTAHKQGKEYIVDGNSAEIDKNIFIQGNFIVNGNSHDINNIVQLCGQVINNSNRSIIR